MLNLVWSKEQNVKEAVVSAYRKLYLEPGKENMRYVGTLGFRKKME